MPIDGPYDKFTIVGPDGEEADVVGGVLQTSGGGGGGGGPATIADGADVAEGSTTDVAATVGGAGTVSAKLRLATTLLSAIDGHVDGIETLLAGGLPAALGGGGGVKVDGSGTALPVSSTTLATSAKQDSQITLLAAGLPAALGAGLGLKVEGNIASDAPVTANPLLGGGRASTAVPTPVSADGDAVATWLTRSGAPVIDGGVASAATDSGNPVKIGGVGRTATVTPVTDGQRVNLSLTPIGAMIMAGTYDGTVGTDGKAGVIGVTRRDSGGISEAALGLLVANQMLNGTTWDRQRNNESATLLASAARTATTSSADQTNYNGRGVLIVVNVTAEAGTTTLTLTVQGKDAISSNYFDLIAGVVVYNAATDTPTVTRAVMVYPGVLVADAIGAGNANLISAKSLALPRTWRATITPSDASSQTYSLSAVTIL